MYNTFPVTYDVAFLTALAYIRNGMVPLVLSAPGIGKTRMAADIAKALECEQTRHVRLLNITPEAAHGLQFVGDDKKTTVLLRPSWMPPADGSWGKTMVFFDEYTQAPPENRQGVMSVFIERYLGEHRMPDNAFLFAAGNTAEDGSMVFELDRPGARRVGIILLTSDLTGWCDGFAADEDVDLAVVTYLLCNPEMFEMSAAAIKSGNAIAPSPATWVEISDLTKDYRRNPTLFGPTPEIARDVFRTACGGKIGEAVAGGYIATFDQLGQKATLEEILAKPRSEWNEHVPTTIDDMFSLTQQMIWAAVDLASAERLFELLDELNPTDEDMPYVEARFATAESILRRIENKHGVPLEEIVGSEVVQKRQKAWKAEAARIESDRAQAASLAAAAAEDAEETFAQAA